MPTTYAHWRFGDHVIKTLPEDLQIIINKYRSLFDYGVHGPDIFFYYNCIKKDNYYSYGSHLHGYSMRKFAEIFKKAYFKSENKEASLSYILGFLAHFTLDSAAHSYIQCKAKLEGPSHNKIESQYDRHLMILDGHDPVKFKVTNTLKPTKFNAHIIAQFFDRFDDETMLKIIKAQPFYLNLLKDTNDAKRWFLTTAMRTIHVNSFIDLMTTKVNEPSCIASNERIDKYFAIAEKGYRKLADSLMNYINNDTPLDPYFDNHFEERDDYMSIPLLDPISEKDYVVDFEI